MASAGDKVGNQVQQKVLAPKINQDSFKVIKSFPSYTKPFNWLFGVFDGHGPHGEIISQFVAKTMPDHLNSKLTTISQDYSKKIFMGTDKVLVNDLINTRNA